MVKLEDNPPILYPLTEDISDIYGQWWVARTKSRHEKALARTFENWDIPYFLPLVEKVSRRKGRKLTSYLPLFSGYIFFSGNEEEQYKAMTTDRIAQVIKVVDQESFINDLTQVHQAIKLGAALDPYPKLKAGTRCRVISGPFLGLEGILLKQKNQSRLFLKVEMLGQGATVEIDSDQLEPVE